MDKCPLCGEELYPSETTPNLLICCGAACFYLVDRMAHEAITEHIAALELALAHEEALSEHVARNPVWTNCPECGPNVPVDEDGCCLSCGQDALFYGHQLQAELAELRPRAEAMGCRNCTEIHPDPNYVQHCGGLWIGGKDSKIPATGILENCPLVEARKEAATK